MSSNRTIGGEQIKPKICRDCREWKTGGHCKFWKQYKYALHNACGYFMPREEPKQK